MSKRGPTIVPFVQNASNPAPAAKLPQGFTMTQHLKAKNLPSGAWDASPFKENPHVRTITAAGDVEITAGLDKTSQDYEGPPAYSNASANPATVSASPPKPKKGTWPRNTVQVTCDVLPAKGPKVFTLHGPALGCTVNAKTGNLQIGDRPGTVTVRISDGSSPTSYDEVSITIT
jgi:hypothetical protein